MEPPTTINAGASSWWEEDWLVAHPAVVVNYNMESKIILASKHSSKAEPVKFFPQEFEFNIRNLTPDWRLWQILDWRQIYWQGGGASESRGHQRLAKI